MVVAELDHAVEDQMGVLKLEQVLKRQKLIILEVFTRMYYRSHHRFDRFDIGLVVEHVLGQPNWNQVLD